MILTLVLPNFTKTPLAYYPHGPLYSSISATHPL